MHGPVVRKCLISSMDSNIAGAKRAGAGNSLMLVSAFPESVVRFRGDLIRSFVERGYNVSVLSAEANAEIKEEINDLGSRFISYDIDRNGMNPLRDFATYSHLKRLYSTHKPDIVLAYTIKPVIWGGIAARSFPSIRFSSLITGLGYAFQGQSVRRRMLSNVVTHLYRFSLRRAESVIFQNQDNLRIFVSRGIVPESKCRIVPGSGVSLFHYKQEPIPDGEIRFLLIARLLKEKGIREYVEAAKIVKKQFPASRFLLVGPSDPSPDGIPLDVVKNWDSEGVIEYLGATNDVRPYLHDCHVFVLPSYHEGMPRTVLEAMATGRPILTTDVCGCRETVENGKNGWLVPKADSQALAERMIWFLKHPSQLAIMGNESRTLAEHRFDVEIVNSKMLEILQIQ